MGVIREFPKDGRHPLENEYGHRQIASRPDGTPIYETIEQVVKRQYQERQKQKRTAAKGAESKPSSEGKGLTLKDVYNIANPIDYSLGRGLGGLWNSFSEMTPEEHGQMAVEGFFNPIGMAASVGKNIIKPVSRRIANKVQTAGDNLLGGFGPASRRARRGRIDELYQANLGEPLTDAQKMELYQHRLMQSGQEDLATSMAAFESVPWDRGHMTRGLDELKARSPKSNLGSIYERQGNPFVGKVEKKLGSRTLLAAERIPDKTYTKEEALKALRNVKGAAAPEEELKWIDWDGLSSAEGPITKDQLIQYIKENPVPLKTRVYGPESPSAYGHYYDFQPFRPATREGVNARGYDILPGSYQVRSYDFPIQHGPTADPGFGLGAGKPIVTSAAGGTFPWPEVGATRIKKMPVGHSDIPPMSGHHQIGHTRSAQIFGHTLDPVSGRTIPQSGFFNMETQSPYFPTWNRRARQHGENLYEELLENMGIHGQNFREGYRFDDVAANVIYDLEGQRRIGPFDEFPSWLLEPGTPTSHSKFKPGPEWSHRSKLGKINDSFNYPYTLTNKWEGIPGFPDPGQLYAARTAQRMDNHYISNLLHELYNKQGGSLAKEDFLRHIDVRYWDEIENKLKIPPRQKNPLRDILGEDSPFLPHYDEGPSVRTPQQGQYIIEQLVDPVQGSGKLSFDDIEPLLELQRKSGTADDINQAFHDEALFKWRQEDELARNMYWQDSLQKGREGKLINQVVDDHVRGKVAKDMPEQVPLHSGERGLIQRNEIMEALSQGADRYVAPVWDDVHRLGVGAPKKTKSMYDQDIKQLRKIASSSGKELEDFHYPIEHYAPDSGEAATQITASPSLDLNHLRKVQAKVKATGKAIGPFDKYGKLRYMSILPPALAIPLMLEEGN